ncbi:MAG: LysM peptidoglycan-binding domain-containing protein [Candidatus Omnitrophica bacterium]|nr:LysM peptidoglycan-binding domain-containing protein [Candidatus Omnitrophota bacterium]
MRRWVQIMGTVVGILALVGCRTATRLKEVPRVDLQLEGGNRGYLVGTSAEAPGQRPTRQMLETEIEIPSFYKPKRTSDQMSLDAVAPPETTMSEGSPPAASQPYDIYVVQPGDSLWSIAAKPEIYGKATRWRRIFDANRDLLKAPDRVRAGMRLNIPRGTSGSSPAAHDDEGTTFKK